MAGQCGNTTCCNPLPLRTRNRGRRMLYCSVDCRREAEYAERRKSRTFDGLKAGFASGGEAAIRRRLVDDPDFADSLITLAETYLKPPDGRIEVDLEPGVLQLLLGKDRSFSVIGHDNPLPSDALIDHAERTGDWMPMLKNTLHSMTWQLAKGFKPDLTEFPKSEGGV